ncbi:hypothetical protein EDB83DRAFT_2314144 [Lactarius deliciosus]|nr:hypothetical protein EDB83DRAFT_2314144 [Lactarius deliciosus]
MANSLLPTPDILLQMQRRFLLPSTQSLSLRLSVSKHTILRTHRLSHQSLNPSSGEQFQKTSHHRAKELLEASSSPSAAGVPHTPSANSNSASTALPLLLLALSPSSSLLSTSSRRFLASSSKSTVLTFACPASHHTLKDFAVGLLICPSRIMMREELEQELDEVPELGLGFGHWDKDRIIGRIQDFLDESDDILHAKDCEQRITSSGPTSLRSTSTTYRQFTETAHTSSLTAVPPAHSQRKRDKYVSAELQERRKARRKRLRELERITDTAAAVDPFTPKKCGKEVLKATR